MSERALPVTHWSDPLCIWAYVTQDRLDRVLDDLGDRLELRYRVVPVFGSLAWRFSEGPWAEGGVEGRVEATRRVADQFGHDEVSGEVWAKDTPASSWAAGAAIKAVFTMEERGEVGEGCGALYQWRLRQRFFVDEINVARRGAQLALAEELDVPRGPLEALLDDGGALARLWEDYRLKEEQRIQGSPTWVLDGGRARFYGNFTYEALRAAFDALLAGLSPGASRC